MAKPKMKQVARKVWKSRDDSESLVTTVPPSVVAVLDVEDGNWLVWQVEKGSDKAVVMVSKTKPKP